MCKTVTEGFSLFDPTGILTIAAAFIHPSCYVPFSKPEKTNFADFEANSDNSLSEEEKLILMKHDIVSKVPDNCL